jgi:6-pyruvoyltetrahydropterin/6-carboxytetrahydropterin synthase
MITAERFHDIDCGHRVVGQGGKCEHLHGHSYRVTFKIKGTETENNQTGLDSVGRVLDFSVIKEKLCSWLETYWDHRILIWNKDIWYDTLWQLDRHGVIATSFNPTAENMAQHLLTEVGPQQLKGTGCTLISVKVEETRKCSASAELFV